jgi:hypothetical protein
MTLDNPAAVNNNGGLHASAAATTVVLNSSKFDSGATCVTNSWTTVDITQQTGDWWHVDNFTTAPWANTKSTGGIMFNRIADNTAGGGTKSMWMAALPPVGPLNTILCGYAALPGYGNGWNQAFCTKNCLTLTCNLDVAMKLKFDSEPSYDGSILEYTNDCTGNIGWTKIDGGVAPAVWSGPDSVTVIGSYAVGAGPVKVRLHFTADTSWSNQDGFYPGFGVAVDSLKVEGLALENFDAIGRWRDADAGVRDDLDLRARDEPAVGAAVIGRDDAVLGAPQYQGWHRDPAQPVLQLRVVHVRAPGIEAQRIPIAREHHHLVVAH